MASEWRISTLAEAGITLIDCNHRTPSAAENGYPYIAIPQLKGGHIDLVGVRRISYDDYVVWTKKLKPQEHDVIVVRRCNSGDSAVVPAGLECAIGQNLVVLRADGMHILPEFLRWLVRGPDWWSEVRKFINVGAVFDSLKCREIPNFEVRIPPLREQQRIAEALLALDDRIELLRQTNATLEAIAQALFKSWFVDFDPVCAKAAGLEPEAMDTATAALFPSTFDDVEGMTIPEGWSSCVVYDLAQFVNGAAYKAFSPNRDRLGLPIVKIAELKAGIGGQTAYSTIEMPQKYRIDTGDILFSWSGNPDTSIDTFVWSYGEALLNQHIFRVVPTVASERTFVLLALKYLRPTFAEIARDKQTTGLGHVTVADLKQLRFVKPHPAVLEQWNKLADKLVERAFTAQQKAQTLIELRDTLLPRLISGKLRLPEVEATIEESTA